jgi:uncharacterized iron-regulated membrane protein
VKKKRWSWALLDIVAIVILASGLYLWPGRRRTSLETRLREIDAGGIIRAETRATT